MGKEPVLRAVISARRAGAGLDLCQALGPTRVSTVPAHFVRRGSSGASFSMGVSACVAGMAAFRVGRAGKPHRTVVTRLFSLCSAQIRSRAALHILTDLDACPNFHSRMIVLETHLARARNREAVS